MVSFIISYKENGIERRNNLDYLIKYLNNLNIPKIEILVVEQDSSEKYESNEPNIRKIFIKNDKTFNKGWGYNVGAKESKYNILFFNDSDLIMTINGYIEAIDKLKDYDVVDPYRKIYYYDENFSKTIMLNFDQLNSIKLPYIKMSLSGVISGGAFVIKKQRFLDLKGFDENCYGYGYEDDIFDTKMRKLGYNICYNWHNSAIHLYHPLAEDDDYYSYKNKNFLLLSSYYNMNKNQLVDKISKISNFGEK